MKTLLRASAFAVVPAVALFVLTANPARLYAEGGVGISSCPVVPDACEGRAAGSSCNDAGTYACRSFTCQEVDGGGVSSRMRCEPLPPACSDSALVDACSGKTAQQSCGDGGAGVCTAMSCADAAAFTLVCQYTSATASTPPAGSGDAGATATPPNPPSVDEGCTLSTSGATTPSAASILTALALSIALRRRRRAA